MANNKRLEVTLAFSADTRTARSQIKSLQDDLAKLSRTPIDINAENFDDLKAASIAANELQIHLKNAINQDTGKLDFTKLNKSLRQSHVTLGDYSEALLRAGADGRKIFDQLSDAIASSEIPLKRTNKLIDETWKELKNAAKWQISSRVIDAFASGIRNAYDYAQDLNESLNNIRIVTGQNIDQMSKFAERANKAARALSTTTTEYTDAALIYYQQGLSDAEVEQRTNATVKMANVTGESAQAVSDQMTAIWNNFYDGSKSLEYYADVITELGAATASSTDEISAGLEKFASVADTVGLSYEYATSALATVTSETRQSADVVGTAFKTLFARIQDLELGETLEDGTTMGKYSEALNAVGINIKDSNGALKDMDDILDEMGSKWSTLNKDQQVALAQTVAGVRQYTQLVSLMDNWGTFQENLSIARTSEGTLQEQADIYAESWQAASDRVKAALESIYSELINDDFFIDLLGFLEKVLGYADNLIDSFGGLGGVISQLGLIFTQIFSKKITEGIRSATEASVTLITQAKAEKTAKKQAMAVFNQQAVDSRTGQNYADEARSSTQKQIIALKNYANSKSEYMNDFDKQEMVDGIGVIQALHDKYVQLAESMDVASEKQKELVQNLQNAMGGVENAPSTDIEQIQSMSKIYAQIEDAEKAGKADLAKNLKETLQADYKIDIDVDNDDLKTIKQKIKDLFKKEILGIVQIDVNEQEFIDGKTAADSLNKEIEKINQSGQIKLNTVTAEEIQDAESYKKKLAEIRAEAEKINASNSNQVTAADAVADQTLSNAKKEQDLFKVNEKINKVYSERKEVIDNIKPDEADYAQKITASVQAITTLTSVISTSSGVMDAWGDDTKSTGEKLLSTVTAVGSTGVSIFTALSAAATTFNFTLSAAIWPVTLIVAALAGLTLVVKAVSDAIETPAEKMERLQQTSDELNSKLDETKSRANDIRASFDTYGEIREKLDSCTQGTKEWNEALKENNEYVLELLTKYPELLKYGAVEKNPTTGEWTINEKNYNKFLEDTVSQTAILQSAAQAAEIRKNYEQSKQGEEERETYLSLGPEAGKYNTLVTETELALAAQNSQGQDEFIEELRQRFKDKGLTVDFDAEKERIRNDSTLSNREKDQALVQVGQDEYQYNAAIAEAKNLYASDSVVKYLKETETKSQNEQEFLAQNELIAATMMPNASKQDQALAARLLTGYNKGNMAIDFSTLTTEQVQAVLGDDYRMTSDGQFQRKNKNGEWINAQMDQTQKDQMSTIAVANQVEESKAENNEIINSVQDETLKAILQGKDLSEFTSFTDGAAIKKAFDKLSAEQKEALGIDEDWYNTIITDIDNMEKGRQGLLNSITNVITQKEDLSTYDLEQINQALIGSSKADSLAEMFNLAGDKAGKMAKIINEADTEAEIENITETFAANGIKIDENNEHLKAWQDAAIKAAKAGKTYEQRLEEINAELEKYGIDEEKLEQMKDYFKEINPELAEHEEALTEAARKQLLLSTGLNDLTSNVDNYKAILQTLKEDEAALANPETLEQLNALKISIAQVLDTDPESIDNNFLIEHLEEINRLAKGDIAVLEKLRKEQALNILQTEVKIDDTQLNNFINMVNGLDLEAITIDANINLEDYFDDMAMMMSEAGISVSTIQKMFNSLGFSLEPEYETMDILDTQAGKFLVASNQYGLEEQQHSALYGVHNFQVFKGFKGVKYSDPSAALNSGGKGKSGGGSSPSKKDTKDNIKADDHIDRYKEINDVLDDINDTYEKLNSQTDRYFGANRIQALKNESEALKLVNQGLRKKYDLTEQYLNSDKKALEAAGFTVDDTFGNITNYEERMKELIAGVNSAIDDYNTAVNTYNGKITEDTRSEDMENDENIIESKQEAIDAAQEKLDNAKELISKYDESREQMEDLEKEIRNNTYAIQDLNAEIVAYALEMKLLVSEIKMDEIELKLGDLEVFDSLYDMAEKVGLAADKMDLYTENLKSYSDAFLQIDGLYRRGSELLLPNSWEKSIQKGLDRIDQINNNQEKKTFNDNNRNEVITSTADYNTSTANAENTVSQADYIKQVQESRDGIIEMLKAIQELDKEMLEYYGETISKANEELGKFTSKMEHLTSVLNHYKSLTDMLGRPTDYENIGRMLKGQADLIRDQVEVAKATYEMYQGEVDDLKADLAQAEEGTYLYEMLSRQLEEAEQAMMESQENMLAKTEEWAGLMKQILENDLAKAAQALENALTGGTSFDQLAQQWERANSLQENYLTATNQIYETTKLMRNAQKEIDKTSNEAAKNRLNAFVKETEQLRDQGKLSNYELEVQQAKYDLLLAEIALEEARNAKSIVRLQRDNEGNYGYVYTADQDKIADAEQKVDDANNRLYNISLEGQINYSQQYQGLMQEYYNALVELQTNYQNGAFESEAEYQNQKQQLLDYYNKKAAELLDIYNMATLTSMEATNDAWTTNLMDIIAKEDEWTIATQDYLIQVEDAFKTMEEAVSQVEKDLGIEFGNMESSITKITNASDALKQSLVDTTIPEIKKTFADVQAATQEYGAFRTEIAGAVTAAKNLVTKLGNIVKDAATVVTEVDKETEAFEKLAQAIRDVNKAKSEEPTDTTNTTDNNTNNTTPKNPDNNNNNKNIPKDVQNMAESAAKLVMKVHSGSADLLAAGYIPNKNGWREPAKKLGYSEAVIELARKAFSDSDKNSAYGYILDKALKIAGYDTGGYTGSWGTAGKLALLHEKELVLNKEDTKNLLASVQMVRDYIDSIDLNTISMLALNPYTAASLASQGAQLDQNVTIEANFPSVTDRNEIEEALKSLVNRASQYINK